MAKSTVPVSSHDSRCSPSSCTTRSLMCGASAITRLSSGGNSLMTPASTTQNWNVRFDIRGSKPTCWPRKARIRSSSSPTGLARSSAFGVGSMLCETRTNSGSSK